MFISEMLLYGVISLKSNNYVVVDSNIYKNMQQSVFIATYDRTLVKDIKLEYSVRKNLLTRNYYEISK